MVLLLPTREHADSAAILPSAASTKSDANASECPADSGF